MAAHNHPEQPQDIRRGQGILDERHYRELSTDLHQMQLAFEGKSMGGHYLLLATNFAYEDFFPAGDEQRHYSQFPNLSRFFFLAQMLLMKDGMELETRIADWKHHQRGGNISFAAFYEAVEREYERVYGVR